MRVPNPADTRKILLVTLSNLGDVVLTLPVLKSLMIAFPKAEFHVMGSAPSAALFAGDKRIASFMTFAKKAPLRDKLELLRQVRRQRYDIIVDLKRSLIGLLGGARHRNRYLRWPRGLRHRAQAHLSHLDGLCAAYPDETYLMVDPAVENAVSEKLRTVADYNPFKRTIAAAVGSKSDVKRWSPANYANLLDSLALNEGCQVLLLGDTGDAAVAREVASAMRMPVINWTGLTDLPQLVALIKLAALLVTNDSAPLHIADALRTPVLAIFGPTDPVKYGPRFGASQAIHNRVFCAPCERAQCRYRRECFEDLTVARVLRCAEQILRDETVRTGPRILAIRLDRLGDVVLSLPALAAIRRQFPLAQLTVMTRPATAAIVDGHPLVDEVITYHYEKKGRHRGIIGNWRLIREVIRHHFDIVFILNPSVRSYMVSFAAQIPYRIGFDPKVPWLLTKGIPDLRAQGKKHESDYTMDVVRAFEVEPDRDAPVELWPVSAIESAQIDGLLERFGVGTDEPFIAVHPHASCFSKRWPSQRFAAVIERLRRLEPSLRMVLIGGPEASGVCRQLCEDDKAAGVVDLSGRLDLRQLGALLKRCRCLLSNDSGPVHVAAAVGTKTVTIYGRNQAGLSVERWKALGSGHRALHRSVGCAVCQAHRCTIDFACLKAVTVDEVNAAGGINGRKLKLIVEDSGYDPKRAVLATQKLVEKDKIFAIERRGGYPWSEGHANQNQQAPLPATLSYDGRKTEFSIRVCDPLSEEAAALSEVTLHVVLFIDKNGFSTEDRIAVSVKGQELPDAEAAYDLQWKDQQIVSPDPQPDSGRVLPVNPDQKLLRVSHRVSPSLLHQGVNLV
ncbi:MAG: glycosyltransferase family 9 protein, partial [Candidatus Omnitrophota bacterium]